MQEKNTTKIGILGAGAWGSTLAYLLGQTHPITLWHYDPKKVRRLSKTRRFKKPLSLKYPDTVEIVSDLNELKDLEIIINTVPLKGIETTFQQIESIGLNPDCIIVNASKGIEPEYLLTPSELIKKHLPNNPLAAISGPNLAKEMIKGKPMVTMAAAESLEIAERIQQEISGPTLRAYSSDDLLGTEICAALKNVIAIAAGCIDGLELGESAKASLLTRGIHEIGTFIQQKTKERHEATLLGPAGIGDLMATAGSKLSRNYRVGYYLAKGKSLEDTIDTLGEVAEGVNTTFAVSKICKEQNIKMPIVEQVKAVLTGESDPINAVISLMNRPVGD